MQRWCGILSKKCRRRCILSSILDGVAIAWRLNALGTWPVVCYAVSIPPSPPRQAAQSQSVGVAWTPPNDRTRRYRLSRMVSRKSRKRDADIGRSTSYVLHAIVSLFKYLVSFTRKSYAFISYMHITIITLRTEWLTALAGPKLRHRDVRSEAGTRMPRQAERSAP